LILPDVLDAEFEGEVSAEDQVSVLHPVRHVSDLSHAQGATDARSPWKEPPIVGPREESEQRQEREQQGEHREQGEEGPSPVHVDETGREEMDELYAFYVLLGERVEAQQQSTRALSEESSALQDTNQAQASELGSLHENSARLEASFQALHETIVNKVQAPAESLRLELMAGQMQERFETLQRFGKVLLRSLLRCPFSGQERLFRALAGWATGVLAQARRSEQFRAKRAELQLETLQKKCTAGRRRQEQVRKDSRLVFLLQCVWCEAIREQRRLGYLVTLWGLRADVARVVARELQRDERYVQRQAAECLHRLLTRQRHKQVEYGFRRLCGAFVKTRDRQRLRKRALRGLRRARAGLEVAALRERWGNFTRNAVQRLRKGERAKGKMSRILARWQHAGFSQVVIAFNAMRQGCASAHAVKANLRRFSKVILRMQHLGLTQQLVVSWNVFRNRWGESKRLVQPAQRLVRAFQTLQQRLICSESLAVLHRLQDKWHTAVRAQGLLRRIAGRLSEARFLHCLSGAWHRLKGAWTASRHGCRHEDTKQRVLQNALRRLKRAPLGMAFRAVRYRFLEHRSNAASTDLPWGDAWSPSRYTEGVRCSNCGHRFAVSHRGGQLFPARSHEEELGPLAVYADKEERQEQAWFKQACRAGAREASNQTSALARQEAPDRETELRRAATQAEARAREKGAAMAQAAAAAANIAADVATSHGATLQEAAAVGKLAAAHAVAEVPPCPWRRIADAQLSLCFAVGRWNETPTHPS